MPDTHHCMQLLTGMDTANQKCTSEPFWFVLNEPWGCLEG